MADPCASGATIQEMLDALETEVEILRSLAALAVPRGFAAVAPSVLRTGLEQARLTPSEFARITGVPREDIEDWLAARTPTPAWVSTTLELAALLPPSVRRKMLRQPLGNAIIPTQKDHPFSRIEDL
ncbi:MAG TPA: hypothetical protein VFQ91_07065 [Bryobacteraceae bacterium]|nr:hypothetical protein [Bryobacteraceae bacterium]